MRNKIFVIALILSVSVFGLQTVFVKYRSDDTETVKNASLSDFSGKPYFRMKGRKVEINTKKLHHINVFPDTIEIYYGDTWCRVDVYPFIKKKKDSAKDSADVAKDTVEVVWRGWMKISTILGGIAEFGKLSASISELKHVHFRPKELIIKEKKKPRATPTDTTAIDTTAAVDTTVVDGTQQPSQTNEGGNEQ